MCRNRPAACCRCIGVERVSCCGTTSNGRAIAGYASTRVSLARQLPLPLQRVTNNGLEIVVSRGPAQRCLGAGVGSHEAGWIAGAAALQTHLEIDAGNALDDVDNLDHRIAGVVADVAGET